MILHQPGNLLDSDAEVQVNTVNCVGVMGKGLAAQFRRRWPAMYEAYAAACMAGNVEVGRMHVWPTLAVDNPQFIVNFPTKKHWRDRSEISFIDAGLEDLVRVVTELGIESIAVPPLGCGLGGLKQVDVVPRIRDTLGDLPGTTLLMYGVTL